MSTHSNHPFHLVDYILWPLTDAIGAMTTFAGLAKWFLQYLFIYISKYYYCFHCMSLMTSFSTSSNLSSITYMCSNYSTSLSNNFIYFISSIIFCIIFFEYFSMEVFHLMLN